MILDLQVQYQFFDSIIAMTIYLIFLTPKSCTHSKYRYYRFTEILIIGASPTQAVVNELWYDGHVFKSLLMNMESPTLLVVNQLWYNGHIPESLR